MKERTYVDSWANIYSDYLDNVQFVINPDQSALNKFNAFKQSIVSYFDYNTKTEQLSLLFLFELK